ncbi:MarR family transcriptional regulator [Arthrobacter ginkgonis]|uniref:MarR family transcriptional regulator n=1 Tax=Arthrobacter ginkgonis TaxID=1630594 RepID=A0ABP7CKG4_9MICC
MAPEEKNTAVLEEHDRLLASDLAGEIEFLTARTRSLGSLLANRELAPLDLKVRSYSVLSLACGPTPPTQRELAGFLSLDPSQIVALVDQLEKRGLVLRVPDPQDRRSKIIRATGDGAAVYRQAREATHRAEEAALGSLSPAERDELRRLLTKTAFPDGQG